MDLTSVWKNSLSELELELGSHQMGIYFKHSQLVALNGSQATVGFPSSALKEFVGKRFADKITQTLVHQTKISPLELLLTVTPKKTVDESSLGPLFNQPLPDKVDQTSLHFQKTKLSAKYTFDTFVVGSTNNFAHAAALSLVKNPGREYNPFFLYGGVGVGKTHLMQAVGNALYKSNSDLKILYVSAETFMNELIESFGNKSTDQFRRKYRNLDLLMIDDVQFISGKESTQDEIFHTFNSLYQAEKQIILTSDRRPEEIEKVESRITSRFMGGLTVDIQPPDFEMRTAILNEKLAVKNEHWEREVVEYIAAAVESNIRELEGTLNRIITQAKVTGATVDIAFVASILGQGSGKPVPQKISGVAPKVIIAAVAKHFGITTSDLLSEKRDSEFVKPRQVAMFFLRHECGIKLVEVARLLNRKDHTTIMHGVGRVRDMAKIDPQFNQRLVYIKKEVWG